MSRLCFYEPAKEAKDFDFRAEFVQKGVPAVTTQVLAINPVYPLPLVLNPLIDPGVTFLRLKDGPGGNGNSLELGVALKSLTVKLISSSRRVDIYASDNVSLSTAIKELTSAGYSLVAGDR